MLINGTNNQGTKRPTSASPSASERNVRPRTAQTGKTDPNERHYGTTQIPISPSSQSLDTVKSVSDNAVQSGLKLPEEVWQKIKTIQALPPEDNIPLESGAYLNPNTEILSIKNKRVINYKYKSKKIYDIIIQHFLKTFLENPKKSEIKKTYSTIYTILIKDLSLRLVKDMNGKLEDLNTKEAKDKIGHAIRYNAEKNKTTKIEIDSHNFEDTSHYQDAATAQIPDTHSLFSEQLSDLTSDMNDDEKSAFLQSGNIFLQKETHEPFVKDVIEQLKKFSKPIKIQILQGEALSCELPTNEADHIKDMYHLFLQKKGRLFMSEGRIDFLNDKSYPNKIIRMQNDILTSNMNDTQKEIFSTEYTALVNNVSHMTDISAKFIDDSSTESPEGILRQIKHQNLYLNQQKIFKNLLEKNGYLLNTSTPQHLNTSTPQGKPQDDENPNYAEV